MQHSPYEVKDKLLRALDKEYNVVDMATVLEVISLLENAIITRETLEKTRIGKYINELRKRTSNEQLARRAKQLVKSWRSLIPQTDNLVNGERVIGSVAASVLGSSPAFGPGPGNPLLKPFVSAPSSPHFKFTSPTLCERSPSPFCSSASNSPQFSTAKLQGTSKSLSSSYAPGKSSRADASKSLNKSNLSSQVFKPVSPALAAMRHANSNMGQIRSDNIPHPTPHNRCISPAHFNSSRSCSPRIEGSAMNASNDILGNQKNCHRVISPGISFSSSVPSVNAHACLEIAKTNVANKRLRKDTGIISKTKKAKLVISDSACELGMQNGIVSIPELPEKLLPSKTSAFKSLSPSKLNEKLEIDKRGNFKVEKSKRSFDIHASDVFREKFISFCPGTKLNKVKTTQQLIEELQARKDALSHPISKVHDGEIQTDTGYQKKLPDNCVSTSELLGSKSEPVNKIIPSKESPLNNICESSTADSLSSAFSDNVPSKSVIIQDRDFMLFTDPVSAEIEQILSTLPPINPEDGNLSDCNYEPLPERTISDIDVDRYLQNWEHVNGNFEGDGSWRSWHECFETELSDGRTFRILPYVNIE